MDRKPRAPVDFSTKRSLRIRERHGDSLVADNFYHAGNFWRARIPVEVSDVCGQAFNFSPVRTRRGTGVREPVLDGRGHPRRWFSFVNHLQARFKFERDIELFRDADDLEPTHRLRDFVYSVEATGPRGRGFSFLNGLFGRLVCTHRFLSTEEMLYEKFVLHNYIVEESPPLPLTAEEKRTVLLKSIERSDQAAPDERYYLCVPFATNNCTSNPFRIVDQVLSYTIRQRMGAMFYRLPLNPRLYLRLRGLDADPAYRKFVHEEFESYLTASETLARRDEYFRLQSSAT